MRADAHGHRAEVRRALTCGILSIARVPDRSVDTTDPGDDTLRRYRYQAGRAAMLGLATLDENSDIIEIFCEHYEDVLLRRRDGRFDGEQVKTRGDDLSPLKAGAAPIQTALQRFITLDTRFPGRFRRFVLSTNVGFWRERAKRQQSAAPH